MVECVHSLTGKGAMAGLPTYLAPVSPDGNPQCTGGRPHMGNKSESQLATPFIFFVYVWVSIRRVQKNMGASLLYPMDMFYEFVRVISKPLCRVSTSSIPVKSYK